MEPLAPYAGLSPDTVLDARDGVGLRGDGRQLALNSELVILLKPTIIRNAADWADNARDVADRIDQMVVKPKP